MATFQVFRVLCYSLEEDVAVNVTHTEKVMAYILINIPVQIYVCFASCGSTAVMNKKVTLIVSSIESIIDQEVLLHAVTLNVVPTSKQAHGREKKIIYIFSCSKELQLIRFPQQNNYTKIDKNRASS